MYVFWGPNTRSDVLPTDHESKEWKISSQNGSPTLEALVARPRNHAYVKDPNWGYSPSKWPFTPWLTYLGEILLTNLDDPPSTSNCTLQLRSITLQPSFVLLGPGPGLKTKPCCNLWPSSLRSCHIIRGDSWPPPRSAVPCLGFPGEIL